MTQRFKLITVVLASFFTSFIIHASIVFTPNKLSIDLISPDINYGINIDLPNGLIMTGSKAGTTLTLISDNEIKMLSNVICESGAKLVFNLSN